MHTHNAIDIVTPLLRADFNRYKLQIRTLQEFWKVSGVFCVCIHRAEATPEWMLDLQALDSRIKVHIQEDLLCESSRDLSGWYIQQLVKFAAGIKLVETLFYLCLDADTLLGRPVTYADLVEDDCPLYFAQVRDKENAIRNAHEIRDSARCVAFEAAPTYISEWTTKFMRVDIVKSLLARIAVVLEGPWDEALTAAFVDKGWRWGDYLLYHAEAERLQMLTVAHACVPYSLNGAHFWEKGDHPKFDPATLDNGPFILAGSKGGLSAHWTKRRLVPFYPFLAEVDLA